MLSKEWTTILSVLGVAVILFFFSAALEERLSYGIVRAPISVKEPFQNGGGSVEVKGVVDMVQSGPADANIANQRSPYTLLKGVLPDDEKNRLSGLSAKGCYEVDFQNRLMKSSRNQMTNNYKRLNPDSCSAPFTELVNSFYKVDPLP